MKTLFHDHGDMLHIPSSLQRNENAMVVGDMPLMLYQASVYDCSGERRKIY